MPVVIKPAAISATPHTRNVVRHKHSHNPPTATMIIPTVSMAGKLCAATDQQSCQTPGNPCEKGRRQIGCIARIFVVVVHRRLIQVARVTTICNL
jgi:hypothetical protein